ncbi:PREDICTED: meiotic recombination protein DMC1/LIM15 homolog [Nicrophorus vespilloides]|uniref:Meiotic recombination protein DMC1/LIM15 homolog n=1 Tax=Nicrophorus vespilloides TaxID=110193 RepID=A0ABM1N9M4_NICVS|nr:PREDICTED: meiotic recombination protein DMC1/LIM15 homolog [Nicrophorus vespilloides]
MIVDKMQVQAEKEIVLNIAEEAVIESEDRAKSEVSEEEDVHFHDVKLLLQEGVHEDDVKRLKNAGINTVKGVLMTIRKNILALGIDETKLSHIYEVCAKIDMNNIFITAAEVAELRNKIFKLSTGSKRLDQLLGGGIEAMSITEVFGEFGSGKSQLAHTLCVTTQMPGPNSYLGGKVIFVDTEHTFRPDRIRMIADRFNLNQATVLDNILYARAYNSEHQWELLNHIGEKLHEDPGLYKLLIIDSIMALFRVDFSGLGEITDRQKKLGQMMSRLQKMSEEFNIAVFITNQISSDIRINDMDRATYKPIGGNILAHASTNRIFFQKGQGPLRKAMVFSSTDLEESEEEFIITAGGVDDAYS